MRPLENLEANPDTDEILAVCGNLEEFEKANPEKVENEGYPASSAILDASSKYWGSRGASASFDNYIDKSEEFTELNSGN